MPNPLCLLFALAPTQEPAPLPPTPPWGGETRALIAAEDDPWITPAERSGLTRTPSYSETFEWLERLVAEASELELVTIGTSHEGRAIRMVIASREGATGAGELRANGRPTLLAQAGIHAGEIDGKDAGLMLLRDLTVRGDPRGLLERANLLFVPILNVDGHERVSAFGRINQRGPERMGWRTNARNQNLNRDYAKLDTPGVRAVVRVLEEYDPELYYDLHVTDGIDYQYDVTYGFVGTHGYSPNGAAWLAEVLRPACDAALGSAGHVPGPLIFGRGDDPTDGLVDWTAPPRFSNAYGDARHTPTVLVENHSLKPYDQRVLGTYVLLDTTLWLLGRTGDGLREAIDADRALRPTEVPLAFGPGTRSQVDFAGVAFEVRESGVSGAEYVRWTGAPEAMQVELLALDAPTATVARPAAYWVPATHPEVIERLELHGLRTELIDAPREVEVELYRLRDPELGRAPSEGRVTVRATATPERHRRWYAPGSVRVPTDQPLGDLAVLLLEPAAPDSFFQWGFFLGCLERTEYVEAFVMEPLGERMLAEDPGLRAEFEAALAADEELAASPRARLEWLYRRSPWHDAEHGLYPVGRELSSEAGAVR